jgi:four helix bundle protein
MPKSDWESSDSWTWGDEIRIGPMVLRDGGQGGKPPRDLTERMALFGEAIILFAKKIPQNPVNNRLIAQLVGAGTSVGANYCEADDAVSGKDFKQKIGTSRKESKETMFFLRMAATAEEELATEARLLWREAKELNLIFGSIWRK